jgi:NADPH:quinone reductase-like Zn-dependent oxidoreductase
MKAVVRDEYGSPNVLRFEDVAKPVPGDGEVLVRVHAASLNTADLDLLRGRPVMARIGIGLLRPKHRLLGLDVAGRVEAIGTNVTSLQPGEDVWADLFSFGLGAFSEFVCASESAFSRKPPSLTFEAAATVPHSAVLALQGLRGKGEIQPGQRVLIIGAGGCVGPFAIQIAKASGAEVTGVDHTGKLDLMRSAGADHVIDYTREDFTRNGVKYDLILDIVDQHSVLHYRRSLSPRGRYVLIARNLSGFFQAFLLGGWISLIGSKRMGIFMWNPNKKQDLEFLSDLLERGQIKPLIDRTFELSEVSEGLSYLEDGRARGKVTIQL